jgi:NifB/MoaA-like Fe-S oxidoreductase
VQLSNDLLAAGINALPIIHPAVPEGMARLRFFITSQHTEEQIRETVAMTAEKLKDLTERNFGLASIDVQQMMKMLASR